MNTKTSEQKKLMTFTVWSLDVWGHSHDDCHKHECPCVSTNPEDPESYDNPPECECSYDVNDRSRCGTITIEVTGTIFNPDSPQAFTSFAPDDAQLLEALKGEFLKDSVTLDDVEFESSDGELYEVNEKKDGRPVFSLELENMQDSDTLPAPPSDRPLTPFFVTKGGAA